MKLPSTFSAANYMKHRRTGTTPRPCTSRHSSFLPTILSLPTISAYVILQQGGNVDVAMGLAQTARRGMPDSPNAADTLGWAYYQKGIYQSAINQFQEALRLGEKRGDPEDADLHYHLGLAYQKDNKTALARQQLEKAVKINPKNDDARKALSELRS